LSFRIFHANLSLALLFIPVFLAVYVALLIAFKFSPEDKIVLEKLSNKIRGRKNRKEV
jgi:hypothetical protein